MDGTTELRLEAECEGVRTEAELSPDSAVSVGRDPAVDLRIDHPSIAPVHLLVHGIDDVHVELAAGASAVRWRGSMLAPRATAKLEPGEVVLVGDAKIRVVRGAALPRRRSSGVHLRAGLVRDFSGGDPAMRHTEELVSLVAPGDINVLVTGETGAGKEVIARSIHERSARAGKPFIAVSCAAVAETLFESELFGHERGSFTGATSTKVGLLEAAHSGTVFLDEVGEIPLSVQAKLLRAIELREVLRVGATRPRTVDIRFIAATHRDLEQSVDAGTFREDLYYRLNGVAITVPPLRARPRSIRLLAERFLTECATRLGRRPPRLSEEAILLLATHSWPGNVRELRNVMERAVLLCAGGHVGAEHVRLDGRTARTSEARMSAAPQREGLDRELEELERRRILGALEECAGNQTLAAKHLGISRRRLIDRLDAYAVPRPRKR